MKINIFKHTWINFLTFQCLFNVLRHFIVSMSFPRSYIEVQTLYKWTWINVFSFHCCIVLLTYCIVCMSYLPFLTKTILSLRSIFTHYGMLNIFTTNTIFVLILPVIWTGLSSKKSYVNIVLLQSYMGLQFIFVII